VSRKQTALLFFLASLPLLGWWTYGLFDLDEGFYGAVVVEMNRRGEWIVPFYNGVPWWEKPILLYWLAKPLVAWFGPEFGARLPSVLSALVAYGFVFLWAKRRLSPAAATLTVFILASSLLWIGLSRMMMTDVPLAVAFSLATLTFWDSLMASGQRQIWLRAGVGALLGLGVLAKGPVAILLFLPIAAWTWYREKALRQGFGGGAGWVAFAVALLAVVATWYLPAYLQHPQEFVQRFLIEQNLNRFAGGDTAHTIGGFANLIFFIPVLFLGMIPWSLHVPSAWPRAGDDALSRYLATCAAVPFLFFTVSGAKLVHYVLPCCIPLALLVADRLSFRWSDDGVTVRPEKWRVISWTLPLLMVVANAGFHAWYRASGHAEVHELARKIPADGHVAVYQMPRRQKSQGTGKLKLQETSHPSLPFLLDRVVLEAERREQLERAPMPLYVLTRVGRLSAEDLAAMRKKGLTVVPMSGARYQNYRLYRLSVKDRVSSSPATSSR
jgi:4-amino-4-deoxy-L-arabinose transferase-like glycosyltransferase